jgi:hypothetical protein
MDRCKRRGLMGDLPQRIQTCLSASACVIRTSAADLGADIHVTSRDRPASKWMPCRGGKTRLVNVLIAAWADPLGHRGANGRSLTGLAVDGLAE